VGAVSGRLLRVGTWNVRGLTQDRTEVMDFVRSNKICVLGLQETLLRDDTYPLQLRGFAVYQRPRADTASHGLGVALAVRDDIASVQVSPAQSQAVAGHVVWVRLSGVLPHNRPLFVASVYMQRGAKEVWERVAQTASALKQEGGEVLLLGDFNASADKTTGRLQQHGFECVIPAVVGSAASFHRKGRPVSAIDHAVCSPVLLPFVSRCQVLRSEDRSDHWPVVAHLRVPTSAPRGRMAQPKPQKQPSPYDGRIARANVVRATPEALHAFTHHNRFAVLADEDGADAVPVEQLAAEWSSAMEVALSDANAWGPRATQGGARRRAIDGGLPSRRARRALRRRRRAFQAVRAAVSRTDLSLPERTQVWESYRESRRVAFAALSNDADRRFTRRVTAAIQAASDRGLQRPLWDILRQLGRATQSPSGRQASGVPIRAEDGTLVVDPDEA
jgi:exonuclease III